MLLKTESLGFESIGYFHANPKRVSSVRLPFSWKFEYSPYTVDDFLNVKRNPSIWKASMVREVTNREPGNALCGPQYPLPVQFYHGSQVYHSCALIKGFNSHQRIWKLMQEHQNRLHAIMFSPLEPDSFKWSFRTTHDSQTSSYALLDAD